MFAKTCYEIFVFADQKNLTVFSVKIYQFCIISQKVLVRGVFVRLFICVHDYSKIYNQIFMIFYVVASGEKEKQSDWI